MNKNSAAFRYLTVAETAQLLRIHVQHAYRLIYRGQIPVVRVGRKVLIDSVKLEAWLQSGSDKK